MKRVANNRRYYELLHQLENLDPKWSENIGKEGKLNNYYTEGDVNVPGEVIIKCREILAELRAMVDVIERLTGDQGPGQFPPVRPSLPFVVSDDHSTP